MLHSSDKLHQEFNNKQVVHNCVHLVHKWRRGILQERHLERYVDCSVDE